MKVRDKRTEGSSRVRGPQASEGELAGSQALQGQCDVCLAERGAQW